MKPIEKSTIDDQKRQTVGDRLRQIRLDLHLSQSNMSEKLGFEGYLSVARYEANARIPDAEKLITYANFGETTVDWIIHGDNADSQNKIAVSGMRDRLKLIITKHFGNVHGALKKFSDLVGVSQGNVSDWINPRGKSLPSAKAISRICKLWPEDIGYLLTGNETLKKASPENALSISERLKEERENKLIGQYEFAKKIGINPVVFGRYERGEHKVPLHIINLAGENGLDAHYILTGIRSNDIKQQSPFHDRFAANRMLSIIESRILQLKEESAVNTRRIFQGFITNSHPIFVSTQAKLEELSSLHIDFLEASQNS
jgi:transcriptional regulator with XRE-family HTH domain